MNKIKYTLSCIMVLVICNGVVCASSTSACDDYCKTINCTSGTVSTASGNEASVSETSRSDITVNWEAGSATCSCTGCTSSSSS